MLNLNEIYFMEKEFVKNNYKLKNNMFYFGISLIVSINQVSLASVFSLKSQITRSI